MQTPFTIVKQKYYRHAHKHLTAEQVISLFNHAEQCYEDGFPLNRFFTIHYADITGNNTHQKFITDLMAKTNKWLKRRGIENRYLYVLENAPVKGIHAHILIHIPSKMQVKYKHALAKWLGVETLKERVVVRTIGHPSYGKLSPLSKVNGVLRYMCKGIDTQLNLHGIKPKYQGEIMRRRWGRSRPQ